MGWITLHASGSGDADEEGTVHVFLEGGRVTKGPSSLIGANIKHLAAHSARVERHPEGHEPVGARTHPDFVEHRPPEKPEPKPGKPYAREHGAAQTRQEQPAKGPRALSADEAQAGLEEARGAARRASLVGKREKVRTSPPAPGRGHSFQNMHAQATEGWSVKQHREALNDLLNGPHAAEYVKDRKKFLMDFLTYSTGTPAGIDSSEGYQVRRYPNGKYDIVIKTIGNARIMPPSGADTAFQWAFRSNLSPLLRTAEEDRNDIFARNKISSQMSPSSADDGTSGSHLDAHTAGEEGPLDRSQAESLLAGWKASPGQDQYFYGQLADDLLSNRYSGGLNKATLTWLHGELEKHLREQGTLPQGELFYRSSGDASKAFSDTFLSKAEKLPKDTHDAISGTLEHAAAEGVSLYGLSPQQVRDAASTLRKVTTTKGVAGEASQAYKRLQAYKRAGLHIYEGRAPHVSLDPTERSSRDPEHQYEQELNARIPGVYHHLVRSQGIQIQEIPQVSSAENGSYEPDTNVIRLRGSANKHTARHEYGHAVDAILGRLAGNGELVSGQGGDVVPEFRSAAPDFNHIFSGNQMNYNLRPNTRSSRHEMFADAFAMYHGSPEQKAYLEQHAPSLHTFMKNLPQEARLYLIEPQIRPLRVPLSYTTPQGVLVDTEMILNPGEYGYRQALERCVRELQEMGTPIPYVSHNGTR